MAGPMASAVQYNDSQKKKGLAAVFTLYFCVMFFTYILLVAGPVMAADLNGMSMYSVLTTVPSLFSCMAMLVYGKMSDMYGRRIILMIAMAFFLGGSILCAIATNFTFLVIGRCVLQLGIGALAPLCFSVVGDMYDGADRSKWGGMLNVPGGISALLGPIVGGIVIDTLGWRTLFWIGIPFSLIALGMVLYGIPTLAQKARHEIDILGSILVFFAISTMLLGLTWGGTTYPWLSFQVIGVLVVSVILWYVFLNYEGKVKEPIFAPEMLRNKTFMIAAGAGFFSIFGYMGILVYYPLFLQGVQGTTATVSATAVTPFNVLTAFMGVVAGLLLAKTGKYKWIYITGYVLLTIAMVGMVFFNIGTPLWFSIAVLFVAGLGLGSMPTINTLVCQYASPRRLIGVATGAVFFLVTIGMVVAPAIQGSIMNTVYTSRLAASMPAGVAEKIDAATVASLNNPNMLVSAEVRAGLEQTFKAAGDDGSLFAGTMAAVKSSMDTALRGINILSLAMMAISLLMVLSIPEISMDAGEVEEQKRLAKQAAAATAK